MFGLSKLELNLAIGLLAALIGGGWFAWYSHKEILKGEARIEASDARAEAVLAEKVALQTHHQQQLADLAANGAANEQRIIDSYRAMYPVGGLRCHQDLSSSGLPKGSTTNKGTTSPAPGPAPVPKVLAGNDGPDLSEGFDAIMSAAEELAVIYREGFKRR